MALRMNVVSSAGYEVKDAYLRVDELSIRQDDTVVARIRAYVSREGFYAGLTYIEGSEEIISFSGDFSDHAINTKKQAYEYAKTLDMYLTSVDIIE